MKRFLASLLVVFSSFVSLACDESCDPRPLAEACGSKCPKNRAEAIAAVCASDGGQPRGEGWTEGKNTCGGTNVENTDGPFGEIYSFDAKGKLVGVGAWSDTTDGQCNTFDTFYGRRCQGSDYKDHECPGSS